MPTKACIKENKTIIKKNATKAFCNEKKQLYTETNVLGVGLGEILLQVRNDMQFPQNEASDNAAPQPIAFASKGLTSIGTQYSNR